MFCQFALFHPRHFGAGRKCIDSPAWHSQLTSVQTCTDISLAIGICKEIHVVSESFAGRGSRLSRWEWWKLRLSSCFPLHPKQTPSPNPPTQALTSTNKHNANNKHKEALTRANNLYHAPARARRTSKHRHALIGTTKH